MKNLKDNPDIMITMGHIKDARQREKEEKLYRSGGAVNVIPRGVTHEQMNSLGDKGIPIVSGADKTKIAEIELNELTFNKSVSEKIEALTEKYRQTQEPKLLEELGRLVKTEVTENTIDFQGDLL